MERALAASILWMLPERLICKNWYYLWLIVSIISRPVFLLALVDPLRIDNYLTMLCSGP